MAFSVVICGGGIAGLEALLRLRKLAGDGLDLTLVSPDDDLVYRPLAVFEPFAEVAGYRYPLARIVQDVGATLVTDALAWVDRADRTIHTLGERSLHYDALLIAVGGREKRLSPYGDVFAGRDRGRLFRGMLADVAAGRVASVAFVLPPGPVWPLPLYELALQTAAKTGGSGRPRLDFVIPTARPLEALGGEAGAAVEQLLIEAGVHLHTDTTVDIKSSNQLILKRTGVELHPDRIVSLPMIAGPNIRGIAGFALDRFVHVDEHCRVLDTDGHIFAAGDATDFPVKHGGLGAQQADVAAAAIAHLAGLAPRPDRLRPRIEAVLATGGVPLQLAAYVIDGRGWQATLTAASPARPEEKIAADELNRYLRTATS